MPADPDDDEVMRGELALLDPALRAEPARVSELLHPDFVEFGSSGLVWDRATMLPALAADPAVPDAQVSAATTLRLGPDAILLTYVLTTATRRTLRSSVWVRDGGRWQVRFHQGTVAQPG